jgi:hypothetical protein
LKRIALISILISLCWGAVLKGQATDIKFHGEFIDVPFVEFVEKVEAQTGASFYFLEKWIKGVRVTASGADISLRQTLDKTLLPAGLNYVLMDSTQIYISDQAPLFVRLPAYTEKALVVEQRSDPDQSGTVTSTEQKYIDGRKAGILETLHVGSVKEGEGKSNAVIHGKLTDIESDEPLIGATIYFEELSQGAATDVDGRYSIIVKPGKYTVEFKCMGMEEKTCYLEVHSGGNFSMALEKSVISLTEVVVHANRYHNVRGTQMGFDRLNYKVLKEVPVVMGERDILKVVQMFPGV